MENSKNLSVHRAISANKFAFGNWFQDYESWLTTFQIYHGDQVWNVDETERF